VVLDGAGAETAVTQALGSRRFLVTIAGPGGHSFTDAGTPNPILALAAALTRLTETQIEATEPRTTMNVGTISGGTSVNTIPESASASVEFRSTEIAPLVRLEVALHRAVEDAVEAANAAEGPLKNGARAASRLRYAIDKIGDRPAADLPADSPILEAIKAVDRHLGLRTDLRLGSTDANIPMSLGVPADSLGAGGDGGGAHTRAEWYSAVNRELGLKRVLLLTLAMVEWAAAKES
jgi:acetylornithine deacetylase/succinyl-diaminopimelate desuccinylase-like protein